VQPDDFSHDEKPPVVSERLRLELALLKSRSSESKRGAGEKRGRGGGPRVLVVSADQDTRIYLLRCLRTQRRPAVRATGAKDGVAAIEKIRTHLPDLFVLDVAGRSVAMLRHALHGDATLRTVPVVLVTGGTVDVVEPGAAMRVDAVLEMPFNARRMHALIRNLLPRRAAGKPSENEARKP
jgi:DNA-binding response OmpR family regulator